SSGAPCSDHHRPSEPIQSMAVLDDPTRAYSFGTLPALLPPLWLEALLHKCTLSSSILHLQHCSNPRRPNIFPANIEALCPPRSLDCPRNRNPPLGGPSSLLAPQRRTSSISHWTRRLSYQYPLHELTHRR